MLKSMKILFFLIIYSSSILSLYSANEKKSFVWCDNLILGGSLNGKWIEAKDIFSKIKKGDKFKLYNLNNFLQNVTAEKPYLDEQCESPFLDMNDYSSDVSNSDYPVAVFSSWNVQPRKSVKLNNNIPAYKECATQILASNKIYTSSPIISQIYKIDLEGDGVDEVVMTINNVAFEECESIAKKGDYSAIVLRKIINGKVETILIEGTFYDHIEKREDGLYYPGIFTHKIMNFLDLNGDGILEIITGDMEHEGFGYSVYEIKNGKSVKVLSNGWGV